MNAVLPAGIESYLKDAGFSATEMLLLRKLVEQDSLTIRELASKTGKSTGVLDQAMKKLMVKKIAQKNIINDQPRYSINSLDAVLRWVKEDMTQRKKTLERRHENFESFIATLKVDKKRPDIEHYHGLDGIKQAYLKLLGSGEELLSFMPVDSLTEQDPLRLFRVEYFRKRQVRKIFQRILAPDSTLARRFQSRDPFEYRKTLLVPEAELPLTFEKTIVGDTIACFNHEEETACFLRYPDLAQAERAAFEALWTRQLACRSSSATPTTLPIPIPLKTRLLSSFREFVLSRKSLAALVLFALISGALTFGLYRNNYDLNRHRVQEKVLAIASTGALQFDVSDIEAVHTPDDIHKPEYAKLVALLNLIRRSNPSIQYAYIMRKTSDPSKLAFVADADSLHPSEKKDINGDGIIDESDWLSPPGELYDASNYMGMVEGFNNPQSDYGEDQWGSFISGFAPIRDESGNAVAVLGIDVFNQELDKISAQSFTPVLFFLCFFLIFLAIRFGALNRSLLAECLQVLGKRQTALFSIFLILFAILCLQLIGLYRTYRHEQETGKRLMAIAVTAASGFDPTDLEELHIAADMKKDAYQRVYKKLNEIRDRNPEIKFAYIFRKAEGEGMLEFVADADSNWNLSAESNYSIYEEVVHTPSGMNVHPGFYYYDEELFTNGLQRSSFGISTGQWGRYVSGFSPIYYNGLPYGILGLDSPL